MCRPCFGVQKNLTKFWTNFCTKFFYTIWDQRSGPILGHQFGIKYWVTKCGTNILTQIASKSSLNTGAIQKYYYITWLKYKAQPQDVLVFPFLIFSFLLTHLWWSALDLLMNLTIILNLPIIFRVLFLLLFSAFLLR